MLQRLILSSLVLVLLPGVTSADTYTLKVELIQVCDDTAANCTNLGPAGGADLSYLYDSQVNTIWSQAGIDVQYTVSQWNNTEAQRLTSTERSAIYNNTFTSGSGDALPGLSSDSVQIFFVQDHPGTGYNGSVGSGWIGNPLSNPNNQARSAGNAQLYIDGSFSSNARSVMASEGFAADQLSGVIAHEIGHLMGLRHVEDVNGGAGAGTIQDPNFNVVNSSPNLMWGAGTGPNFNGGLTLEQNFALNQAQIDAAIYNGTRLDPDGNGTAVLTLTNVPEPSSMLILVSIGVVGLTRRKRRAA